MVDETLKSPEGDDRSHGRSSSFSSRTTPRAVPPVDLPEGSPRHLGHFRLIRVLGRGGMGVVYLASDEQLDRLVAVKVLPFHRAHDAETVARFEREALAVTELAHPSIVPIYHVGEDAGNRFFVMRYVDGEPLNDYAARVMSLGSKEIAGEPRQHGRSTTWRSALGLVRTTLRHRSADLSISLAGLADILRVVEQTARALDHAHQHGIVHRDVKPSNVMIDQDGQALLLDFGLARFESEGQGELTRSGDVLGTVSYMAPEQLSDKFGGIDGRTDIYGLGVTLFECLTARRPFEGGSSEAVIYQTLTREAPSPRDFVPELSRDLSTITLKCLEKNKERRYQSGTDLASDLARLRAHQRIEAEPVGRVGRLRRWSELHRTASTLLLFLALLLAAAPLVWGWRQIAAESRRREAVSDARQRARDALAERTDLRTRATTLEQELRSLDKRVEPWAAVDDPGKRRLLAGRNELAALRRAANELGHAARFAADEALELAEGETDELEQERVEILRTVYLQAESDRDQSAMRTWSDELRSLGREDLLAGTGHLTLISQPAGASVVIRKWVPGVDGRLVLDETPAYTGATPIVDLELPLGSFVAHLEAPGYMTSNYPVLIERNQHWGHNSWHDGAFSSQNWTIKLPRIADVDSERWCLIHGGPFLGVTDQDATPEEGATEWFWEDAFLIERTETNYRRYGRFLDDADQRVLVWQSIVDEQPRYVPREGPPWKPLDTIASSEDQDLDGALKFAPFEKFLELPVTGVSQRDAVDFAAWESEHSEYLHQLPSARQWEKAARGVDGRPFPWGQIFRRSFAHGPADSSSKVTLDYEVGTMPSDESPYGVRDLAGGVREWCRDGPALQEEFVNPWLAGGDISSSCLNPIDFVVWPRIHRAFSDLYLSWGFRLVREATRKQAR